MELENVPDKGFVHFMILIWNLAIFAAFTYLIFWKGASGWWYVFMLVLMLKKEKSDNKAKLEVVKFKQARGRFEGNYPFTENENLLMLGEIEGMEGHIAVADKEGKVYWAYKANHFVK